MKVIIVEDEFLAQQELSWLIKTHSQMEIVGCFEDGLDVLKFLQHNRVDAIFLDINIPSLDGVLLAQNINQFAHKPFIVFVTAGKSMPWRPSSLRRLTIFSSRTRSRVLSACCISWKPRGSSSPYPPVPARQRGKTTRLIW